MHEWLGHKGALARAGSTIDALVVNQVLKMAHGDGFEGIQSAFKKLLDLVVFGPIWWETTWVVLCTPKRQFPRAGREACIVSLMPEAGLLELANDITSHPSPFSSLGGS